MDDSNYFLLCRQLSKFRNNYQIPHLFRICYYSLVNSSLLRTISISFSLSLSLSSNKERKCVEMYLINIKQDSNIQSFD